MSLDLPTSLIIAGFTSAIAGGLLLLSWLQHRKHSALALWAAAFTMGAVATALIAARNTIPDIWSIWLANAILAAAYGILWSGVRTFEGRSPKIPFALAGVLIWLLACISADFYAVPTARVVLMAGIGSTYSLLAAGELWRGRSEALISRWPIMILLAAHAAAIPMRIPLVASLTGTGPVQVNLLTFVMFESVLLSMCGAYLFGSIAKERVTLRYKQASLLDPLTAVANRRAFLKQSARLLVRSSVANQSVALLSV